MAPLNGVGQFLYGQIFVTPPMPQENLEGKTIIVTGASAGLGLCASHILVQMRVSTLILAVRNTTKGEEARRELLSTAARTKISEPRIEVWKLDLCSYASIISFADRCKSLPRLDAVLENAGINTYDFVRAEGDESTITTNVLGTFLLGILLLPTLRMSAKRFEITPRIAFVGSVVHFFAPTKELMVDGNIFDTLSNPNNADMKARYFVSKLVATMMIRELAERITASSKSSDKPMIILTDNAPGLNKTFLTTNSDANDMGPRVAVKLMARKPEIGARTLVQGLVAGQEAHGKYLSECVVKPSSAFVRSQKGRELQKKLWREMMLRLEKVRPGLETLI